MKQVSLRLLEDKDVNEEYLSWFNDPDVTKFLEVDGNSLTRQKVIDYINYGKDSKSYFMYAICLCENNKHIGNLKIGPINYKHNFSDLVTVIGDKQFWGKGIATEAIKLGIDLCFKKYNIRKLSASIYSNNIRSLKCYTSAGFTVEGIQKNHCLINDSLCDKVLVSCFNPHFKLK